MDSIKLIAMNTTRVLLFIILGISLTAYVADAQDTVSAGTYELLDIPGAGIDASCPKKFTITVSKNVIPAANIELDGTPCSGGTIKFTSVEGTIDSAVFDSFLEKALIGSLNSQLECGSFLISVSDDILVARFTDTLEDFLDQIVGAIGFDVGPEQISAIQSGVDYIATGTVRCLWQHTGGGSECFPSSASVLLQDGRVKRMDELRIGDSVQTGREEFSPIFAWTHQSEGAVSTFVSVKHATSQHSFKVTPNHFVYKKGGELVLARDLRIGDVLVAGDGSASEIETIEWISERGLYNPQTVQGDIVVDGITASTYTLAVQPMMAHAMLSPVRAVFKSLIAVESMTSSFEL